MNNDPSQRGPGPGEEGAEDSQVRTLPQSARKRPGKATGQLAAVLEKDPRFNRPTSEPGKVQLIGPDEVPDSVKLAQVIRAEDPGFTAEKFEARASGAKATLQVLAPSVTRQREMRRFAVVGTILMIAFSATIVTWLVSGVWPWTLIWQVIRAA